MNRLALLLLRCLFSLLVLTACFRTAEARGADGRIVVLALNNLHSQMLPVSTKVNTTTVLFGGLAHAGGVIAQRRASEISPVLLFQAGNAVSGPLWRSFGGEPEFAAMERLGVQAGTLGNREFNYGTEHLKKALARTSMPVVVSNLSFKDTILGERVRKNAILPAGELKVGVFGLASPNLFALADVGDSVHVEKDLPEVSRRMIADLRKQEADIVIMLSSLSLEENILLAGSVGGIHAILGGASREELHDPLFIEGPDGWETILGQAGAYGAFVGRLALAVERGRLKRDETSWNLLRVTPQTEPDRAVMALAVEYEQKLNEAMLQSIGFFSDPADSRSQTVRTREAALGNLITDALRWRFKTDIGIINAGGIRSDRVIPAGSVYRRILDEILPFENDIHIVSLTGRELRQVFEISASALVGKSGDSYDPSVRTHSGGFLQVSGIRVTYAPAAEPTLLHPEGLLIRWGNRVRSLAVERNGKWMPVEDDAVYTVAANSWTAGGGDRYFVLRDAPQETTGFKDIDVLADYIASHPGGRVKLSTDGRIRILFPQLP